MNARNDTAEPGARNVDARELAKFADMAARWWDPESAARPLHDINPARVEFIASRCGLAGKRVVDVGCGGGLLSESMAARGADVVGIDAGESAIGVARLHGLESGIRVDYRVATAEELAADAPGTFEVVTCLELVEHVPDPVSLVAACARLARPGGDVFFSTINRTLKSFLLAIVGAEHVLRLLPAGTHDYASLVRPSELDAWARAAGLSLVEIAGLRYNPLTRRCTVGDDIDVNYIAWFRAGADGN